MLRHIPGLASLKAFDASARHLNFTRAAAELNVTPAAVSHQIKELEEAVGVPLFQRTSRHMQMTRQGLILKPAIGEALEGLTRALQRIRQLENPTQVRVTASPSIAAKWLVPQQYQPGEVAKGDWQVGGQHGQHSAAARLLKPARWPVDAAALRG